MALEKINLKITSEFSPQIGWFYAMLEDQHKRLKEAVANLTPAELAWQINPRANSIGILLIHIAEAELWWIKECIFGDKLTPEQRTEYRCDIFGSANASQVEKSITGGIEFFFEKLDKARAIVKDYLTRLTDADLETTRPVENPSATSFDINVRWILYHLVEHESHHRGQILMLKKLLEQSNLTSAKPPV